MVFFVVGELQYRFDHGVRYVEGTRSVYSHVIEQTVDDDERVAGAKNNSVVLDRRRLTLNLFEDIVVFLIYFIRLNEVVLKDRVYLRLGEGNPNVVENRDLVVLNVVGVNYAQAAKRVRHEILLAGEIEYLKVIL